jgi:hypothetical protein
MTTPPNCFDGFATSPETEALDTALAAAQGEIEAAAKDKINPAFRSKYADLSAVWDAIRPALSRHKVSVTQWPVHSNDNRLHIVTRLAHAGQWIACRFSIPVTKADAHGHGSAITYAKRYTLAAAIGVVADEDDDGNAASKPARMPKRDQRPLFDELYKELRALKSSAEIDAWGKENRSRIHTLDESWQDELRREAAELRGRFRVSPHGYDDLIIGFETELRVATDAAVRHMIWEKIEDYAATQAIRPEDMNRLLLLTPEKA